MMKIIVLLLASLSLNADPVKDPSGILPITDKFLGDQPFDTAFEKGDSFSFSSRECIEVFNKCENMAGTTSVKSTADLFILLETIIPPTASVSETRIERSEWERNLGNLLRLQLERIQSFGIKIELKSSADATYEIEVNGRYSKISVLQVNYSASSSGFTEFTKSVYLARGLSGLGQIVQSIENQILPLKSVKTFQVRAIKTRL